MEKKIDKLTIKDWDPEDRPREKLALLGEKVLSTSELLAVLVGSGSRKESAVALMQRLLSQVDNDLHQLAKMPLERMTALDGIGEAKALKIKAALALGKRLQQFPRSEKPILNSSKRVFQTIQHELVDLAHEEFWILYANQAALLLQKYCLSKGGISATTVDICLAFKKALELGATAMVLVHNHTSGALIPSAQDKNVTRKFKTAAANLDIRILDHLIVSEKGYFSFADENIL